MKSVKHSVCALSFLFVLLFISLFSCQKQAHSPTVINTIKEQEAKQWLNQNYPNGLPYPGGMDTTIITARTSATFIQTQWSQTETYGGLLRVPTGNAYNRNIQKWIIRDLFFAKDSTGNIHSLVYEVRVDTSYIHKKMKEKNYNYSAIESYIDEKDFSGDILLYTLNNKFLQGRRYVDGAYTYNVAFPKNTISNQGASKDEEPAEVFDWRWLDEVVVTGTAGGGSNSGGGFGGFIYFSMGPTYSYSNSGGYSDNNYYNNVPIVGGSGGTGTPSAPTEIKLDPSFKNNQKTNCAYTKLNQITQNIKASGNSALTNIWLPFWIDNGDVTFKVAANSDLAENGRTNYIIPGQPSSKLVVSINSNVLPNRTPLELAKIIIHESIHANLLLKYYEKGDEDFYKLIQYQYIKTGQPGEFAMNQHNYMAQAYVEPLAKILYEFDNHSQLMDYYRDIAWTGLQNTPTYNNLPQSDKDRILATQKQEETRSKKCE